MSATQDALNRGDSLGQATAVAEAARQRVRDDYGRAADGGSLEAPPKAPAAPAERAAAPAEGAPEILEPPPKEPEEGEEGEAGKGGESAEPAVIDVPQAQQ
jgi:hypothetical protein